MAIDLHPYVTYEITADLKIRTYLGGQLFSELTASEQRKRTAQRALRRAIDEHRQALRDRLFVRLLGGN